LRRTTGRASSESLGNWGANDCDNLRRELNSASTYTPAETIITSEEKLKFLRNLAERRLLSVAEKLIQPNSAINGLGGDAAG
jgi:hypothetical protein